MRDGQVAVAVGGSEEALELTAEVRGGWCGRCSGRRGRCRGRGPQAALPGTPEKRCAASAKSLLFAVDEDRQCVWKVEIPVSGHNRGGLCQRLRVLGRGSHRKSRTLQVDGYGVAEAGHVMGCTGP